MKRVLSIAVLTMVLAAGACRAEPAGVGGAGCRIADDEERQKLRARGDDFSAGLLALDRGDIAGARAAFDRALVPPRVPFVFVIGGMYKDGACLPRDLPKAAAIYGKGADMGFGASMLELSLLYWHGLGVPEDRDRAIDLFRHGLIALDFLGGTKDIPNFEGILDDSVPDPLMAQFEWVERLVSDPGMIRAAAEDRLRRAHPDALSACRYLVLAANRHGDAEAAYRLAMMHLDGREIAPSKANGFRFLEAAALDNHPEANAEIGRRLISQEIKPRGDWHGLAWLIRANALGADVEAEVEAARRGLSPESIREAEIQAKIIPPLDRPTPRVGERCIGNGGDRLSP